jgi:hypothetical protein
MVIPLFALRLQAVQQQSVVDMVAGISHALAVAFEGRPAGLRIVFLLSNNRRPISVDLPSSTEPAVRKRSKSFCSSLIEEFLYIECRIVHP